MAALSSSNAAVFPHMLRDPLASPTVWSPQTQAGAKKSDEQPQDDVDNSPSVVSTSDSGSSSPVHIVNVSVAVSPSTDNDSSNNDSNQQPQDLQYGDYVPVRNARSQSLTVPATPPMFASPTSNISNTTTTTNNNTDATTATRSDTPLSAPECIRATTAPLTMTTAKSATAASTAPLVSQQQLASDPRFARRSRRSMSAEFTLSMLQQELGYPTRKPSRRDSVERNSRRTSSILEEDALHASSVASISSDSSDNGDTVEPEPERRSSVSAKAVGQDYNVSDVSDDDDDDDDNFLATRVASVTGFSQDADGVVYYEIIVRSVAHGPLSAYKVRRRYSEFRALHRALAAFMPVARRASVPARTSQHAHAFNSGNDDQDVTTASCHTDTSGNCGTSHFVELPPLPDRGGLWAYLQFDTTPFLERRAQHFEALLVACQTDARARASRLLHDFVGAPPDAVARDTSVENSYVSLNRFAAPKLRLSVEAHERKQKARNISRRRSSVTRIALEPDATS